MLRAGTTAGTKAHPSARVASAAAGAGPAAAGAAAGGETNTNAIPTADLQPSLVYHSNKAVIAISISTDNAYLASCHGDHTVKVFQLSDHSLVR